VIIFAEALVEPAEAESVKLTVVIVEDDKNKLYRTEVQG
jgi:hypothetical protein